MHYYIISRIKGDKREYLHMLKAGEEEWTPILVGAKNYPTKEAAEIARDAVRQYGEHYEVVKV